MQLKDEIVELISAHEEWVPRVLVLLSRDDSNVSEVQDAVEQVRAVIAAETGCRNTEPVDNPECSSAVRADLLESWRKIANDPDDQVHAWLTKGAPAGIREHPVHRGVFPHFDAF